MNSRNGLRNITPVNTAIIIINVITFIVLERSREYQQCMVFHV